MKKFQENINLASLCNYRIGGPARFFFEAKDRDDILWSVKEAKRRGLKIFILGSGTNLLVDDRGFDGLVLKPGFAFIQKNGSDLRVGAGVEMRDLLDCCAVNSLSGLEWAGGLPGTLGGAVRGNAGAFGGETKDSIKEVESFDVVSEKILKRENGDCKFSYRSSVFKEKGGGEIILAATLSLKPGNKEKISEAVNEKIEYRKKRHPLDYPNVGSVFKNVDLRKVPEEIKSAIAPVIKIDPFPVVPAAYLISESSLKGVSFGGAMISPKHPNFIVNSLGAKSSDVKTLITLVKQKVKNKFKIDLEEEVQIV